MVVVASVVVVGRVGRGASSSDHGWATASTGHDGDHGQTEEDEQPAASPGQPRRRRARDRARWSDRDRVDLGDGRLARARDRRARATSAGGSCPSCSPPATGCACLARTPAKLAGEPWRDQVEVVAGRRRPTPRPSAPALAGVDRRLLPRPLDGRRRRLRGTRPRGGRRRFRAAADRTPGLEQIVYLGGLGDDDDAALSPPPRQPPRGRATSLADGPVPVTELRAAVIIGSGSASFEMLRNLTEVLPVMITPAVGRRRAASRSPSATSCTGSSACDRHARGRAGGCSRSAAPRSSPTEEMMRAYAEVAGLPAARRAPRAGADARASRRTGSAWSRRCPLGLARPLDREPRERGGRARPVRRRTSCPTSPLPLRAGARAGGASGSRTSTVAITVVRRHPARAARPADPMPTDPDWAGGTLLSDEQDGRPRRHARASCSARSPASAARGAGTSPSRSGRSGAAIDVLARRRRACAAGGATPTSSRVGDALDFWRVEAVEPPGLLRLRAEMLTPGDAWLEWRIEPDGAGGAVLHQRALFHPRGLPGRLYWYGLIPFHALIFKRLCAARLAAQAAERSLTPANGARGGSGQSSGCTPAGSGGRSEARCAIDWRPAQRRPERHVHGSWRSTRRRWSRWRLTALTTARSDAVRMLSSRPTPQRTSPSADCVST